MLFLFFLIFNNGILMFDTDIKQKCFNTGLFRLWVKRMFWVLCCGFVESVTMLDQKCALCVNLQTVTNYSYWNKLISKWYYLKNEFVIQLPKSWSSWFSLTHRLSWQGVVSLTMSTLVTTPRWRNNWVWSYPHPGLYPRHRWVPVAVMVASHHPCRRPPLQRIVIVSHDYKLFIVSFGPLRDEMFQTLIWIQMF